MTRGMVRTAPRCIGAVAACVLLGTTPVRAEPPSAHDLAYELALESIGNEALTDAITRLERLRADAPHHAGALLDLAILYCRIGNRAKVDEALSTLEHEFSPPPQILALIRELREHDCAPVPPRLRWSVSTVVGHDTNVNQGSSVSSFVLGHGADLVHVTLEDEFLPKSSMFFGLNAYASRATDGGSRYYGAFSAQRYASVRGFDQDTLSFGYERVLLHEDGELSTGLSLGARTLGGSLYQKSIAASVRMVPPTAYRAGLPLGVELRAAYVRYPTRRSFDNLETSVLVPSVWQLSDRLTARVSGGWLYDRAQGSRPGGDRSGPMVGLEFYHRLPGHWRTHASWHARALKGESAYAPPLFNTVQRQRRHVISLAAERWLSGGSTLRFEYQHTRNRDTIPIYRFDNDSVMLFWIFEGRR